MINGAHVIIYSRDADADRAFLRDVLGLPDVDAGDGWLIFKLPPAELAAHPTEGAPRHEFYLMCDDIHATLDDLAERGVQVDVPIRDRGWGLLAAIRLPSGGELPIYQPRHPLAKDL
ncbi:VOC family protein [Spirillospora sp. NPDC046719]